MSISEMQRYFKILLNKLDASAYQNLEPEEIDIFLNQGMFRLIEQRAYGTNPKGLSIEETQKRVDDLKNITNPYNSSTFTTDSSSKPNGIYVALPSDYRHAVQEDCSIIYTDCLNTTQSKVTDIVAVTHDRYNKVKRDPFNKPYEDKVIRLSHSKVGGNEVFELITDGTFTISAYNLVYLRTPVQMQNGTAYATPTTDVNCELSEHLHREIVELAIKSAIEAVESPRIMTYPQIQKDTE